MRFTIALVVLVSALTLGGCSKEDPEANLRNPTADKPADPSVAPPAPNNKKVKFGPAGKSASGFTRK